MSKPIKVFACIFLIETHSVSGSFEEKKLNSLGSLRGKGTYKQFWKKKARNMFKIGKGKETVLKASL